MLLQKSRCPTQICGTCNMITLGKKKSHFRLLGLISHHIFQDENSSQYPDVKLQDEFPVQQLRDRISAYSLLDQVD